MLKSINPFPINYHNYSKPSTPLKLNFCNGIVTNINKKVI